jgi:hypothetical protein
MYELMERKSASLVGTYPDLDIALLVVLETVRASGESSLDTVVLGQDDPTGETDGEVIAEGPALVDMARRRYDRFSLTDLPQPAWRSSIAAG